MRTQQLLALSGLLLASNIAIAAKLEHDDVPNRCWAACGPVVGISESCVAQHDNDSAELQCICNWSPAKTQIPLCAACITLYEDDDDDDDNDALDIVHSCSFSTTTYNAAAATTLSASASATDTEAVVSAFITAAKAVSGSSSQSSSATTSAGSTSSGGSASSSTPTTDAAAGITSPGPVYMAALLGMLPLAWL